MCDSCRCPCSAKDTTEKKKGETRKMVLRLSSTAESLEKGGVCVIGCLSNFQRVKDVCYVVSEIGNRSG